jgi:hypothetical protein
MTGTDIALVITAFSTLTGVVGGIIVQIRGQNEARQDRAQMKVQLTEVHNSTNGLAARNEAIAQKLGVAQGTAVGLEQGRDENAQNKTS